MSLLVDSKSLKITANFINF